MTDPTTRFGFRCLKTPFAGALAALIMVAAGCDCTPTLTQTSSELLLEPERLDFGDVTVGTTATKTVTIINRSKAAIGILSMGIPQETLIGVGADGTPFSVSTEMHEVPAASSATLSVTFSPTAEGAISGQLIIESNASEGGTAGVELLANAVARTQVVVDPPSLDFGDVLINTKKQMTVRVRNDGSKPFSLSALAVQQDAAEPQWQLEDAQGKELAPNGGEMVLTVGYAPTRAATAQTKLIVGQSGGAEVSVELKGRCQPKIRVSVTSIDFGEVDATASAKKLIKFYVENVGYAPLKLLGAKVTQGAPVFGLELNGLDASPYTMTLNPSPPGVSPQAGASVGLVATFSPRVINLTYSGTVDIPTNDPEQPVVQVPLSGRSSDQTPAQCGVPSNSATCGTTIFADGFDQPGLPLPENPSTWFGIDFGTVVSGWHVDRTDVDILWDAAGFNGSPHSAPYCLDLNGWSSGSVSREIPTTPNRCYLLEFFYTANPGGCHPATGTVTVGSGAPQPLLADWPNAYDDLQWSKFTVPFTATSSSTQVMFASTCPGNGGIYLDTVTVKDMTGCGP